VCTTLNITSTRCRKETGHEEDTFCCNVLLSITRERMPIPVAAPAKAYVCGLLVAGIAGANPAEGMDVCLLCLYSYVVLSCVGRGLCDVLITRPEESYRVCLIVCSRSLNTEEDKAKIWAVVP
jgi:hypothetical protein